MPRTLTAALPLAMLLVLVLAVPAPAAERFDFTLEEQIDFEAGSFTFTASEPLCPSGTFEDTVKVAAFPHSEHARADGVNLLIETTYTCDDGSGTFDALKHVFISETETGFTNVGPTQIHGGTGDYAGIVGHALNTGEAVGALGSGTLTGFVLLP